MGKTQHRNKRVLKYGAIILAVIFLISAALLLLQAWERRQGQFSDIRVDDTFVEYKGEGYVLKDNVETFLVLGLDKYNGTSTADSYNNDKQADLLMLFVFDNNAKTSAAIQIDRDTMASVNILGVDGSKVDTATKQIALAHTYGNGKDVSCRNTADAVSSVLLGTKINHYISLTIDSVEVLNDLVGGVEVTVLDDFSGVDDTLVKGETVTLTGQQALRYVRMRQGLEDSKNSTRMKRQRQYIDALYDKLAEHISTDKDFVVEASVKLSDYIISDRSVTQLQELAKKFNTYEFTGIRTIDGELVRGDEFMEFHPAMESVEEIVIEQFYQRQEA